MKRAFVAYASNGLASGSEIRATSSQALASALKTAPPNSVIHLASGNYSQIGDTQSRTGWVTVTGAGDATPPIIHGATLWGAQYLRFVDVHFTGEVYISNSPYIKAAQPAKDIQVLNSEVSCGSHTTSPATDGIMVRAASQHVTLAGDYVHNCVVGFASVAQDDVSTDIVIEHDTFQDFPGDAIDLGGLENVTIAHDVIRDMVDPQGAYHDDGIQLFGNVHDLTIAHNVLANSRGQLILIQDAVRSGLTHSSANTNVLVTGNLIYGAAAWAVQVQGGRGVRFIANTMWCNHFGSLLLRRSGYTGIAPSDAVIVDNIIEGFGLDHVQPAREDYNLLASTTTAYHGGPHDIRVSPTFVNWRSGDFRLSSGSAGRNAAVAYRSANHRRGALTDLYGVVSAHRGNLGALQAGDPSIGYGSPRYGPSPLL